MSNLNPIVLDMEMSGLDVERCGIWQIGAVDLSNPEEQFLEESRIDDEDLVETDALRVIGKTEEELRNENKQSQKEMIQNFMNWIARRKMRTLLCHNPQSDVGFLQNKVVKYGLKKTFQHRAFDSHTLAQLKHFQINNEFLMKKNEEGKAESNMNLTNVLKFCGIPDERIQLNKEGVVKEGNPHNALEDAKLTGECFFRIVHGKNLFQEYSQFEIPEVLKK